MKIEAFKVEEWMNAWETGARYNIAETCCDSVSLDELFALTGEDKEDFLQAFCSRRLTYGAIEGRRDFKEGICLLYKTLRPEGIVPTTMKELGVDDSQFEFMAQRAVGYKGGTLGSLEKLSWQDVVNIYRIANEEKVPVLS